MTAVRFIQAGFEDLAQVHDWFCRSPALAPLYFPSLKERKEATKVHALSFPDFRALFEAALIHPRARYWLIEIMGQKIGFACAGCYTSFMDMPSKTGAGIAPQMAEITENSLSAWETLKGQSAAKNSVDLMFFRDEFGQALLPKKGAASLKPLYWNYIISEADYKNYDALIAPFFYNAAFKTGAFAGKKKTRPAERRREAKNSETEREKAEKPESRKNAAETANPLLTRIEKNDILRQKIFLQHGFKPLGVNLSAPFLIDAVGRYQDYILTASAWQEKARYHRFQADIPGFESLFC